MSFSTNKNITLQQESTLNPRLINRCVDKALQKETIDCFDHEPPFLHLCSEQPHIPVENVDVVRRPQAFGRWALPRLYRELHSKDPIVALQAINTVCDLVHNPERTFEAINLKFVNRVGNLLMKSKNPAFQERILMALYTIAGQALGRQEIAHRPVLINGFKALLNNTSLDIRCKTAGVLEMLSRSFVISCTLIEEGYISVILQHLIKEDSNIIALHLQTLERLFCHTSGQEEGIYCDAFTKLTNLLEHGSYEIKSMACRCLAMLTSHPNGKKIAQDESLLDKMLILLKSQDRDVYTCAAEVIMFATHTVAAKHKAATIKGLDERLLQLANDFKHPPVQMFAMKALGNMLEQPELRKKFCNQHLEEVEAIKTCGNEEVKMYKKLLLKTINWKPWIG